MATIGRVYAGRSIRQAANRCDTRQQAHQIATAEDNHGVHQILDQYGASLFGRQAIVTDRIPETSTGDVVRVLLDIRQYMGGLDVEKPLNRRNVRSFRSSVDGHVCMLE
jgi:hypothetical protein